MLDVIFDRSLPVVVVRLARLALGKGSWAFSGVWETPS